MNREGVGVIRYRKLRTQARAPALHKFFGVHRQECLCHKTIIAVIAGIAGIGNQPINHRRLEGERSGDRNSKSEIGKSKTASSRTDSCASTG